MIYKSLQPKSSKQRGYTLLFAVLVSSVVLSIGISILNISKKEFLLASSARESTTAFYAADSGLECAMYWNDGSIDFIVGTHSFGTPVTNISCALSPTVDVTYFDNADPPQEAIGGNAPITEFHVNINDLSCAIVNVEKYEVQKAGVDAGGAPITRIVPVTRITSRGYNIGWNEATQLCTPVNPSPRRVERALRFTF